MARFMARIISARKKEVHRLFHNNGNIELNGWNKGIRVESYDDNGEDKFKVFITGGSKETGITRIKVYEY
jgi:hypothetical protein